MNVVTRLRMNSSTNIAENLTKLLGLIVPGSSSTIVRGCRGICNMVTLSNKTLHWMVAYLLVAASGVGQFQVGVASSADGVEPCDNLLGIKTTTTTTTTYKQTDRTHRDLVTQRGGDRMMHRKTICV